MKSSKNDNNLSIAVKINKNIGSDRDDSIIKVDLTTNQIQIRNPSSSQQRVLLYDKVLDATLPSKDANYGSNLKLWKDVAEPAVQQVLDGISVSFIVFGGGGSGKSHTLWGPSGILSMATERIIDFVSASPSDQHVRADCSYINITTEDIRDVFNPLSGKLNHIDIPKYGNHVCELTHNTMLSSEQVENMVSVARKVRVFENDNQHRVNFRSHEVFEIEITMIRVNPITGKRRPIISKLQLVEVASVVAPLIADPKHPSDRLADGFRIDQSIRAFRTCMESLAWNSDQHHRRKFVPYDDSVLTKLLKPALQGERRTIFIACASPKSIDYEESYQTLLLAEQISQIKIRTLLSPTEHRVVMDTITDVQSHTKAHLASLQLSDARGDDSAPSSIENESRLKLDGCEQILHHLETPYLEKQRATRVRMAQMDSMLTNAGLLFGGSAHLEATLPRLLNICQDSFYDGILSIVIPIGVLHVGTPSADMQQHVCFGGLNIMDTHCLLSHEIVAGESLVTVTPLPGATVYIQGAHVLKQYKLCEGDIVQFGQGHLFYYHEPQSISVEAGENGEPLNNNNNSNNNNTGNANGNDDDDGNDYNNNNIGNNNNNILNNSRPKSSYSDSGDEMRFLKKRSKGDAPPKYFDALAMTYDNVLKGYKEEENNALSELTGLLIEAENKLEFVSRAFEKVKILEARLRGEDVSDDDYSDEEEEEEDDDVYDDDDDDDDDYTENRIRDETRITREDTNKLESLVAKRDRLATSLSEYTIEVDNARRRKVLDTRKWKKLQNLLLLLLPRIDEANALSAVLMKGLTFSLQLLRTPQDGTETTKHDDVTIIGNVRAFVCVDYMDGQPTARWRLDTFMGRLLVMEEMYEIFNRCGGSKNDGLAIIDEAFPPQVDPFFDPPAHAQLGTALLYLDGLKFLVEMDEWLPIIDDKGRHQGELRVHLIPHLTPKPPSTASNLFLDDEMLDDIRDRELYITITIMQARDLPFHMCTAVFARYMFYKEDTYSSSHRVLDAKNIAPRIQFRRTVKVMVDASFIRHIKTQAVEFEVFGTPDPPQGNAELIAALDKEHVKPLIRSELEEAAMLVRQMDDALQAERDTNESLTKRMKQQTEMLQTLQTALVQARAAVRDIKDQNEIIMREKKESEALISQERHKLRQLQQQLERHKNSKVCTIM